MRADVSAFKILNIFFFMVMSIMTFIFFQRRSIMAIYPERQYIHIHYQMKSLIRI